MKKILSYLDYIEIEEGLWNWFIFYVMLITIICFFVFRGFQHDIITIEPETPDAPPLHGIEGGKQGVIPL